MKGKFQNSKKPAALLPIALMTFTFLSLVPVTHAYGNSNTTQLWQIAISGNFNGPGSGQNGGGGFWVWAVLNSDFTGDATVTDCGHGFPTAPYGGAQHVNADITGWTVGAGSAGPNTLWITSEIDTVTGHTGGPPITFTNPAVPFDTGVPLVAGHYNTVDVLGFKAPGVSFQIQVVYIGP